MSEQRRRYSLTEADAEYIRTALKYFIKSFDEEDDKYITQELGNMERIYDNLTNYEWRKER